MAPKHRAKTRERRLRPTLVGGDSVLDLRGQTMYDRMRDLMPLKRRPIGYSARMASKAMTPTSSKSRRSSSPS